LHEISLASIRRQGTLFRYGPGGAHVAFKSGLHTKHLVAVGGLTDGLLFAKYIAPLATALDKNGISLIQTMLSSSHQGWGLSSLRQDADELAMLLRCLKREHTSQGAIILGHSTGCQDACFYAKTHKLDAVAAPLVGVILQAPVSDREYLSTLDTTTERLQLAQKFVEDGKGDDVAFRMVEFDGAAVTASRWLSLAGAGGDDDMFSSDLSDDDLKERLSGLRSVPTLVMLSGQDEFVPERVDYEDLGRRIAAAIGPSATLHVVEGAVHALHGKEEEAVELIAEFAGKLCWPDAGR
jgi:pimeloyl-ACP methyl ester carboxylesterase